MDKFIQPTNIYHTYYVQGAKKSSQTLPSRCVGLFWKTTCTYIKHGITEVGVKYCESPGGWEWLPHA